LQKTAHISDLQHLKIEAYLEDVLKQISRVSKVSLPTGALQRSDLQAFIRKVYRNKNLAIRTRRSKYVAFSASRYTTKNTPDNRAHPQDSNPSLHGDQSMEVSNGVAQELQGENSMVVSVDNSMEFLAHVMTELKM
jgi:hypothetical protein